MSFDIHVTLDKLPSLADSVRAALAEAVDAGCKDIQALAQEKAPVDTGHLKGSIEGKPDAPGALTGTVSVGADYGVHVEYGTHKTAAQSFMRPAFAEGADAFFDDVADAIKGAAK